ncbi:MAG TPA: superinfection immunity protein [Candidatus Aquilonibacter sp.]|nr:superinfection immunity protein [Candidatus Aquilonibacter sp.]
MFFFAFCTLLYFLPSIIGHDKRSFTGILLVNILLGWTVVGWLVALIWACTDEPRVPMLAVTGPGICYCCRCGARNPVIANYCRACGQPI